MMSERHLALRNEGLLRITDLAKESGMSRDKSGREIGQAISGWRAAAEPSA